MTKKECTVALWFIKHYNQSLNQSLVEVKINTLADEFAMNPSNLCRIIKSLKQQGILEFDYRINPKLIG